MKVSKIFILLGVFLFLGFSNNVYASSSYVVGMVYDGVNLKLESNTLLTKAVSINNDSKLIFDNEVNDKNKGDFYIKFWIGEVYMPQIMYFSPKKGNFKLEIPSLPHIQKLEVYKPDDVLLFEIDVTKFSTCNNDRICQYELGETQYNCVADCVVDNPVYSDKTKDLFEKSNDAIKDSKGRTVLIKIVDGKPLAKNLNVDKEVDEKLAWDKVVFLIALILAFGGGVLILIFKKKRSS